MKYTKKTLTEKADAGAIHKAYEKALAMDNKAYFDSVVKMVEEYADANGLQYTAMEGCGHSPQAQHPDQFAEIIRGFLG